MLIWQIFFLPSSYISLSTVSLKCINAGTGGKTKSDMMSFENNKSFWHLRLISTCRKVHNIYCLNDSAHLLITAGIRKHLTEPVNMLWTESFVLFYIPFFFKEIIHLNFKTIECIYFHLKFWDTSNWNLRTELMFNYMYIFFFAENNILIVLN